MPKSKHCIECGTLLPETFPGGLCSACALRGALSFPKQDNPVAAALPRVATPQPTPPIAPSTLSAGRFFGDYELLQEIARGGMGIVYKARQRSLNRIVAVKVMLPGQFAQPAVVQRFQTEAEVVANLQHPNIVAIHEVGVQEGQHYYSMDYVEGHTLAELVRERPLPLKRAAAYLKTIAEAVHYAHQHGILHRDLKPSNILIDGSDQPRITDFGLAKRLTVDSDMTLTGQVLGSPNFMAPEQAEGRLREIGPATEVYALGAILYHLLTRQPPFQADTLTTLLKQVIEVDPVSPRLLNPSIPRDLETICLKCLEKEIPRRYPTAQALADDLGRFLSSEPVTARPVSLTGKAWHWCRRHPVRAGLVGALLVVFVAGLGGVLWQWRQARRNARAEAHQKQLASKAAYVANLGLAENLITEGQLDRARQILLATTEAYRGWEWGWLQRSCNQDRLTLCASNAIQMFAAFSPDSRFLASGGLESSIHLWELETGREIRTLRGHTGWILAGKFSPDGRKFASAGWDEKQARIWDVQTGTELTALAHPGGVKYVSFSPDGRLLATGSRDGKVRLWDATTWQMTGQSADYGDPVYCVEFSPDGKQIAYCGGWVFWGDSLDASVRIWDLTTDRTRRLEGHTGLVFAVAWSQKGDLLVSAGVDGQVKLWNPVSGGDLGALKVPAGPRAALSVAFSPDGRFVAVAGGELITLAPWAQVFDLQTRLPVRELSGHSGLVTTIAFSRDGQWIATGSGNGSVRVWPLEPVPSRLTLEGHDQVVCAVTFSPKGRVVATGSFDQTLRIWDADTGLLSRTITTCFPVVSLVFSPDGNRLLTPGPDNTACVWQVQTGRQLLALRGHTRAVMAVTWSPDGRWVATGSKDGTGKIWDAQTGLEQRTLTGHSGYVRALAFGTNGIVVATGSADGTIRLWDAASGRCLRVLTGHTREVLCLAFSPDGQRLASGSADLTARIWEARTGRELVAPLQGHMRGVAALAFSADGQRLATAAGGLGPHANWNRDYHIRLWEVESGHQVLSLITQINTVHALAFSPSGRRLATAGADNNAAILTVFPWRSADYPGNPQAPLEARIEDYKRLFWQAPPQPTRPTALGCEARAWRGASCTIGWADLASQPPAVRPDRSGPFRRGQTRQV